MAEKKLSLGRGLSSLLGEERDDAPAPATGGGEPGPRQVPIAFLRPGTYQPRKTMDPAQIDDLAASIADKGILQPILVRPDPKSPGHFEIIAGERRWQAAQKARLHEVPILVRQLSDQEALEIALVENLQRQDLSPLEEAEGYQRLMDEFAHTQEALGQAVGKSRSHVANTLRLLNLPAPVKALVGKGDLSAGHARALLTAKDPAALAQQVVKKGLNVRQTEQLVRKAADTARRPSRPAPDPNIAALEEDLAVMLGLRAELRQAGAGGRLILHYKDLDQLDDLLARLSISGRSLMDGDLDTDDVEAMAAEALADLDDGDGAA
ncbi:MAG: ParB/RepB/Spo0J family partition protein [Rhodobacterales bacterium]|nr:ParB/RepB/Spo0J family partition protein [Rhodobacterales bacterium]